MFEFSPNFRISRQKKQVPELVEESRLPPADRWAGLEEQRQFRVGAGGLLRDVVDEEEDDLVLSLDGVSERQVDVGPLRLDVCLRENGLY